MTQSVISRRFLNFSLRTKLILSFVTIGLLSVATVAFTSNYFFRRNLVNNANFTLLAAAKHTAENLDVFINNNLDDLRVVTLLPIWKDYLYLPPEMRRNNPLRTEAMATLTTLNRRSQVIISYTLLDAQGIVLLDTADNEIGSSQAQEAYFQELMTTGAPIVSDVLFTNSDRGILYFCGTVRDDKGKIIGALRATYNASILQQLMLGNNGLGGEQSFAIVLDENYLRLANGIDSKLVFKTVVPLEPSLLTKLQAAKRLPNLAAAELSTNLPDFAQGLTKAGTAQPYFTSHLVSFGNQNISVAVVRLTNRPWIVAFAQPETVYLAPIETQVRGFLLLAIAIAVCVAIIAFAIGQFLARPIVELTDVARAVAAGNLSIQAQITSHDEIGELATVFNAMTKQLRDTIGSLEEQIQARTIDLSYSLEVGQRVLAVRELDELLPMVAELIRDRFKLYYVQIYLMDDVGRNLIFRVGTGSVGQERLAQAHRVSFHSKILVAQVVREKKAEFITDTARSPLYFADALLPETRSQLALPLLAEGRVIGVLDLHANLPDAFGLHNITVFQSLATQLSLSIESARQWGLAQAAQQKSQQALERLLGAAWEKELDFLATQQELGFAYNLATITPLTEPLEKHKALSTPLMVQNVSIGELNVAKPAEKKWSQDEKFLVETIAAQLAQKAENLRLFEATQQQARREQVTRQIADKIRASRNVETALQTAAEELTKALGVARTVIDLNVDKLPD